MKKIIVACILIVVLLLLSWGTASWRNASRIEKMFDNVVSQYNERIALDKGFAQLGLQFKQLSYDKGIFSSRAHLGFFSSPSGNTPLAEIHVALLHGPFALARLMRGSLGPELFTATAQITITGGEFKDVVELAIGQVPTIEAAVGCKDQDSCEFFAHMPGLKANLPTDYPLKISLGGGFLAWALAATTPRTIGEESILRSGSC